MFEHDLGLARVVPTKILYILYDFPQNILVGLAEVELSSFIAGGGPLYAAR